jgi:hypothetical protein
VRLDSPGAAITRWQTLLLAWLAEREGYKTGFSEVFGKVRAPALKYMHAAECDLLTSILFTGGAHLHASPGVRRTLDFSFLEREGIQVEFHTPWVPEELNRLHLMLSRAYALARDLEANPRVGGQIYLEDLGRAPTRDEFVSLHLSIDDYQYFCRQLLQEIGRWGYASDQLFSEFVAEQHAYTRVLSALDLPRRFPRRKTGQDVLVDRFEVLRLMNLQPRDAAELARAENALMSSFEFDMFPPNYFNDFEHIDGLWAGEGSGGSFEDHVKRGLTLAFCSPKRFGSLHAFWRAWLECHALFHLSAREGVPIHLRANADPLQSAPMSTDENAVQLFRLYLENVDALPQLSTFEDLFRLYHDPNVGRFRRKLREWDGALRAGNPAAIVKIREDFALAKRDLRNASVLTSVGGLVSCVALPVAVAGLMLGLPIDFAFTAVGPAIAVCAWELERRASWIKFGERRK